MTKQAHINARFTTQSLTGVQRFASEISAALLRQWPAGRTPPIFWAPARGGLAGQAWEQAVLPWRSRGGVLLNLGNTGPLARRKQLVVLHDAGVFATPEAYSMPFQLWYRALHRGLAARGAGLATVSGFARGGLAARLGISADRIDLLSEGADHMGRVAPDTTAVERLGLAGRPYVLAVGSLAAHKNLAALQATAAMLAERGADLVITGGLAAHVFGTATALPKPARYVGRVSDEALRALYAGAACFVFPSRYEGFGLPALEAMACGCPVVASVAAALPEVCGEAALYCDPADPASIARAVGRVLDDPALADRLRRLGVARAARFTWDRAAALLLASIERLEAGGP